MQIILFIILGILFIWILGGALGQRKEYELWKKISTRKDRILDILFMLIMGGFLIGLFYIIFAAGNNEEENTSSPRQTVTSSVSQRRHLPRRTPPGKSLPNRNRPVPQRH